MRKNLCQRPRRLPPPIWIGCVLLCLTSAAGASRPRAWRQAGFADFAAGKLVGVSVTASGELTAGPGIRQIATVDAQRIWSMVSGPQGELYVGTGDEGRVLRLDPSGNVVWTYDSPELGIHSLALGTNGKLFAGTAPDGLIYQIDASTGEATTLCRTEAHYVWDLRRDEQGRLYAATGQPAKVLRVLQDGGTRVIFAPPAQHVMCLALHGDTLLAGTAGPARIYALGATADSTAARLIFDAPQAEIHDLVQRRDGSILAGAVPAPSGAADSAASSASVYSITPDGAVRLLTQAGKAKTLEMTTDRTGRAYVLTDVPARLYSLDSAGRKDLLLDLTDQTFAALQATADGGLVLGAAQSGSITKVGPATATTGEFISSVQDFGGHARWGRITWKARVPAHTRLGLSSRSGNSANPDAAWSAWSQESAKNGETATSPPGRYLQYRLRLTGQTTKRRIVVQEVRVFGQQTNLPPRITELKIDRYRPQRPANASQDPVQAAIQNTTHNRRPPPARTLMVLHWRASDPNDDELSYRLYMRGAGQEMWKLAERDVSRKSVLWDTFTMPEGVTRVKLVASDAPDNPPGTALETHRISLPFVLDHTPPRVELKAAPEGDAFRISARLRDDLSAVVNATYSVDYASDEVHQLDAADGMFDSTSEQAVTLVEGLSAGEHVIVVRAWDQADNVGVAQIVVKVP